MAEHGCSGWGHIWLSQSGHAVNGVGEAKEADKLSVMCTPVFLSFADLKYQWPYAREFLAKTAKEYYKLT